MAIAQGVRGTGELYAYDTALRIAHNRDLLPIKVYVHAGTRRLGLDQHAIERRDLPEPLQRRPAHEGEDILCIFKDDFGPNSSSANICANTFHRRKAKKKPPRSST